jgi:hypothetical protein
MPSWELLIGALVVIVAPQYLLDLFGKVGSIELGNGQPTVLAMMIVALCCSSLIYVSSLIDLVYVRPHLQGARGPVCRTSTNSIWYSVTRIRLVHRIGAMLGFIAGATVLVALAANHWIRPIDEVSAGVIGAVATVIAGYYMTRAAPLIALAMNPCLQLGDVVELAEEFNSPEPGRRYFVVDIAWEGCKLLEVPSPGHAVDSSPPASHGWDRMVDISDVARLVRRRHRMAECRGSCRHLVEQCLGLSAPALAEVDGDA